MPVWARLLALLLVAAFCVMAGVAARSDSVTIDEFVHVPVGLNALYNGDFGQDPINPHLPRMWAALPLLSKAPGFAPDPRYGAWGMGYDLMQRNVADYHDLFVRARAAMIVQAVILAAFVFAFSRALYGWPAGLVSLGLFAFSPSMLAHGHLATLDMSAALGFVVVLFACWRLLQAPGWLRAAVLGMALGAANLLKLSAFVLTGLVPLLMAIGVAVGAGRDRASHNRAGRNRAGVTTKGDAVAAPPASVSGPGSGNLTYLACLGYLALAGVVALFTLNAGYAFDGTFASLDQASLADGGWLNSLRASAPWLRLPLPLPVINGIDMVLTVGENHEPSYFLAGELSAEGWWYYHLAAFVLKSPLALLLLTAFAAGAWLARHGRGRDEYCLWIPIAAVFAANAAFNSLYIGVRHVLPVYPLLFIAVAAWPAAALQAGFTRSTGGSALRAGVAAVVLLAFAGAGLSVAPRYLSFFNAAAGGPANGHNWLVDSNIDWGQDLLRLRRYMDDRGLQSINLAYFGRVDPGVYGIAYRPLEPGRSQGPTAISASFLMGRPYFWILGGRQRWVGSDTYAALRDLQPVGRAGSMFIFDLP